MTETQPGMLTQEEAVAEQYRKQGYMVLNLTRKGFPDLIVLEGDKIKFLVEVKFGEHDVHPHQKAIHEELKQMGFKVVVESVRFKPTSQSVNQKQ